VLQLSPEQVDRLQALKLQRDTARLASALATAFPDLPSRLGERYAAFIDHGLKRAARHGLTHLLCVARYLACWSALGAEFESKPGFGWAADMLGDLRRPQGAKVFQLCRRTREELTRLASSGSRVAGAMPAATFDAGIAGLDSALRDSGIAGSLVRSGRLRLGEPCDIDAVDLRLADACTALPYRLKDGAWLRSPSESPRSAVTRVAGPSGDALAASAGPDGTPQQGPLPGRLYLLGPSDGRNVVRLRVRVKADHWCDAATHPAVAFHGTPAGANEWRGPLASDIRIGLPAEPMPSLPGDAPRPTIGAESPARYGMLSIATCGLRPNGTPLGELTTQLAVHGSEQYLLQWQREPGAAVFWPGAGDEPFVLPAQAHVECDGVSWEATPWRQGLEALDRQLHDGLGRLAVAWERVSGVTDGRLDAEPQVLCGQAALTWGWAEGVEGLTSAPYLRMAGALDLMACRLNLRLSGRLRMHGSDSRLTLHCLSDAPLRQRWDRQATDTDLAALLAPAQVQIKLPFSLVVETVATDGLAVATTAAPLTGAVVGACGLRPRGDGVGWQWFARLAVEPVQAVLHVHDPLLGERRLVRPLLPAMSLLDWSLG
jgi:hypothetical protein